MMQQIMEQMGISIHEQALYNLKKEKKKKQTPVITNPVMGYFITDQYLPGQTC